MQEGVASRTSSWVAGLRALYSELPPQLEVAWDPVAFSLLPPGLRTLVGALKRVPGGTVMAHRAIGLGTAGLSYGVPLRTRAIDDALRSQITPQHQLVILGAGLDARAYRLPELKEARVFEVDHPVTQTFKRSRIATYAPMCRELIHCSVDFETQSLPDRLQESGHDPKLPTIWIWEGVTMYLTHAAIEGTLSAVSDRSAPASMLCVTYLPHDAVRGWRREFSNRIARYVGEPLLGAVPTVKLESWITDRAFAVRSNEAPSDWAKRYWGKASPRRVRDYERLIVAVKD